MQIDLFKRGPAWQYYIYSSLVLMLIVLSSYALLRSRRRVTSFLRSLIFGLIWRLLKSLPYRDEINRRGKYRESSSVDLEKQPISSTEDIPIVLKWAAGSGRTEVVRNILQTSTKGTKLSPGMSGQSLLMAIQNNHFEAANLLIETGEGLSYTDENNATVLHWAARMGQSTMCQQLLEKGVSLGNQDHDGRTALEWAMRGDDEITINLLLKEDKSSRRQTTNIQTLHFSARMGDIHTIKEFHEQGSSLEVRDEKGQTVLFHAVKGKQHDTVKWLTEEGMANVQAVDKEGLTALHVAAQECDRRSAEILIESGADVNALSSRNMMPHHCIPDSEGARVLILLHEHGTDIDASDKDNNRITHNAASRGAWVLFKSASDLGADLEAPGAQGNTPAHLAAESGSPMILEILAEKNVELDNVRNSAGYTPLMMASRAGRVEVMCYLLGKGINRNVCDFDGRSLIELTIGWGNSEVMSILQGYGANYSDVTVAGGDVHPIWKALYESSGPSISRILDDGLSIEYEHHGVRLLQRAIEASNIEVVRLLIDRGAAVDVPDMRGWTALHSAAYSGNTELLLLVLQKTDNKEPIDQQGWKPRDVAGFYKHGEILKLLDAGGNVQRFAWEKAGRDRIIGTNYYSPPVVDSVIRGRAELMCGSRLQTYGTG